MKSYSIIEVAKLLAVHKRTVQEWIDSGELRAVNTSRNRASKRQRRRILDFDLRKFLDSRSVVQDDPPPKRSRKRALEGVHEFF